MVGSDGKNAEEVCSMTIILISAGYYGLETTIPCLCPIESVAACKDEVSLTT